MSAPSLRLSRQHGTSTSASSKGVAAKSWMAAGESRPGQGRAQVMVGVRVRARVWVRVRVRVRVRRVGAWD